MKGNAQDNVSNIYMRFSGVNFIGESIAQKPGLDQEGLLWCWRLCPYLDCPSRSRKGDVPQGRSRCGVQAQCHEKEYSLGKAVQPWARLGVG